MRDRTLRTQQASSISSASSAMLTLSSEGNFLSALKPQLAFSRCLNRLADSRHRGEANKVAKETLKNRRTEFVCRITHVFSAPPTVP